MTFSSALPGRELHVLDLVAAESGAASAVGDVARRAIGDAGEMLDPQAKEAYRRRLVEIEEDIEDVTAVGDNERAAQADADRD